MKARKKSRCRVCGKWFVPDARTRAWQKTCGKSCSVEWERRRQARWRAANADDWTGRGTTEQTERAKEPGSTVQVRPPPAGIDRVPWDAAQEEFGVRGALLLALLVRTTARVVQTETTAQLLEIIAEPRGVAARAAQTETDVQPVEIEGETGGVRPCGAQTEIDPDRPRGHPGR